MQKLHGLSPNTKMAPKLAIAKNIHTLWVILPGNKFASTDQHSNLVQNFALTSLTNFDV